MIQARRCAQAIGHIGAGMLIGFANVIPGVSGGTVALTVGLYRPIIGAISLRTLRLSRADSRRDFILLTEIACGALIGIVVLARLLGHIMRVYPTVALFLFLGLITATIPSACRHYARHRAARHSILFIDLLFTLSGIALALLPALTSPSTLSASDLRLFLAGLAAAIAMLVPGLSGSFILLLLGAYTPIIDAVNTLNLRVLAITAIGATTGLLCGATLITTLFRLFPHRVWATIIGLLIGSVFHLWDGLPSQPARLIAALIAFIGAFSVTFLLTRWSHRRH